MKQKHAAAAIDLGATKTTVLVGSSDTEGHTNVEGFGMVESTGFQNGGIGDIQKVRAGIQEATRLAEESSGTRILSAIVGIAGEHLRSQNERGIITIADRNYPITEEDRERVLEMAGQINISTSQQIIHMLPRKFWIEGTEHVADPVGMYGTRLDAETHIIVGAASSIENLRLCVEGAGVKVDGFLPESVAAAKSALPDEERMQGVALIDIGASTSSICIYEEGAVSHSASLALAGEHLTRDLTQVLRCPWESAEQLKKTYGVAVSSMAPLEETVEIQAFGNPPEKTIQTRHVAEILQARCEEILQEIEVELRRTKTLERIAAGLVLTGGTSSLEGLCQLASQKLRLPARIGYPTRFENIPEEFSSPPFATSVGLLEYALHESNLSIQNTTKQHSSNIAWGGVGRRLRDFGKGFLPQ